MTKYDNARAMIEKTLDVADTYLTKAEAFTEANLTAVFDFAEDFLTDVRNKALDNVDATEVKETGGETTVPDEPVVGSDPAETKTELRERLRNEIVDLAESRNDVSMARSWETLDLNKATWLTTGILKETRDLYFGS